MVSPVVTADGIHVLSALAAVMGAGNDVPDAFMTILNIVPSAVPASCVGRTKMNCAAAEGASEVDDTQTSLMPVGIGNRLECGEYIGVSKVKS